ncbi:sugar ABC transporter substrate-binding protein [Stappia taiwanensis]|uniref:Sugar ABC transporter substrate-binding protein n=1 Tax=Stappia taiwanensis TaxID=992267 RepID=A0A838XLJ1_9HYPH|nr:sugar ABC transporter substrate-binding protein [Stappia taiwanensis]MBA4610982.1 sugar ABC transporter substrate-binding protein [Stappia taiwanensis]GGE94305.1 sugar ABC transporter substrate-binding protein [Stappia taiwanensis]
MKRLFAPFLTAAAVVGLTAAAPQAPAMAAEDINIIVVSHGQASDPFWSVVKNGVAQAAKDMSVTVDYRAPETFDMVAMAQLIDAAVNQEPDGLIVSIPDGDALGDAIRKAVSAGIPVISMNSGSQVSASLGALLHVGQEEYDAGKKAGEALASMGGKKGLCVNHEVGNLALDQRCQGFADGFGGSVTVLPTTNDPAEILSKVKASLASDGDIDTIMALGASLAGEPVVQAVKDSGMNGSVKVATFDMSANFLQSIVDGDATFAIDQQQYLQGYLPVVFLANNARYGLMPGGNVPSGPNLVTKDKAAQVIDLSAKGIR